MKEIEIRDKRDKQWFIVDNEYLNGYARIFGPVGTSVYLSLCRHANSDTQECYPSMELMAEEIGISRQTVGKYIDQLSQYNLIGIETKYNPETKQRLNNVYTLINKKNWKEKPRKDGVHGIEPMLTSHQKPCTPDSESHVKQINSNNTHINNTNITRLSDYTKDFESFWNVYPEKKGKGKAYEVWNKIKVDKTTVTEAIRSQVASRHFRGHDGKEFPPHPATWLNQRRWEDEVKIINNQTQTKSYE